MTMTHANRPHPLAKSAVCWIGLLLLLTTAPIVADPGRAESVSQPVQQSPIWIQDPYSGDVVLTMVREPDTSLWNGARITDYEESLKVDADPPLGVLTISKLDIQIPIYNGTDEFNLNRGVGRIKGMARLDGEGHLGISGHRDGIFRGLKDIQQGDEILIQSTQGVKRYAVDDITIVPKSDVSVLAPTDGDQLTIVTCYPFYFVGNAPKRYIVTATPRPPVLD